MSKKKAKKVVKKSGPEVINAHAGERGAEMGTYITYKLDGGTHQAFYGWVTEKCIVVCTDMERKIS